MFDLLGVRYLIYPASRGGPPEASLDQFRVVYQDAKVRIFENLHAMPRAFVVHDVKVVPDEAGASNFLGTGNPPKYFANGSAQVTSVDPRTTAVVEAPSVSSGPKVGACNRDAGTAKIADYSAESVTIKVDSECAGLLVFSDAYYPGWTVTVNGRDSKIYPTDVALRGVAVPAGKSTVVYQYRPHAFRIGMALWLLGILIIAAFAVAGVRSSGWRRRKRGEEQPGSTETAVPQQA